MALLRKAEGEEAGGVWRPEWYRERDEADAKRKAASLAERERRKLREMQGFIKKSVTGYGTKW